MNSLLFILMLGALLLGFCSSENFKCPSFCYCRNKIISCVVENVNETYITEELFLKVPNYATTFRLRNANITKLDSRIFLKSWPKITRFGIDGSQLTEIPKNLSSVYPALTWLGLMKNQITSLNSSDFSVLRAKSSVFTKK